jgi:uncharacterized membrane protein
MIDLGTLGGDWSEGRGINNSGWVTGSSNPSGSRWGSNGYLHAFLYDGTTMHDTFITFLKEGRIEEIAERL